jgi:hypothetical protein
MTAVTNWKNRFGVLTESEDSWVLVLRGVFSVSSFVVAYWVSVGRTGIGCVLTGLVAVALGLCLARKSGRVLTVISQCFYLSALLMLASSGVSVAATAVGRISVVAVSIIIALGLGLKLKRIAMATWAQVALFGILLTIFTFSILGTMGNRGQLAAGPSFRQE